MNENTLSLTGVKLATAAAGLRYQDRKDLLLIELPQGTRSACLFTLNKARAAPVKVAARRLKENECPRFLLVNAGNANAGLGQTGIADAISYCDELADLGKVPSNSVLPFSTGVIGQRLDASKIKRSLPGLLATLAENHWREASQAIMTTDTIPKLASRKIVVGRKLIHLNAIAKGAGMIQPNMATMLCFAVCDADAEQHTLQKLLRSSCTNSFHAITVEGDTSTNDSCFLAASGRSGVTLDAENAAIFARALDDIFTELAQAIIMDAEGASRFVTIIAQSAADTQTARRAAMAIANSPLVKTALYAGDPNWGRILAVVGRSVPNLEPSQLSIYLGDYCVFHRGSVVADYEEQKAASAMAGREITVRVELGRGDAEFRAWTSDLSPEYVKINSEYRS